MHLSIAYPFAPARPSVAASAVIDSFGVSPSQPPHVIADQLEIPLESADVACITGPSGSGKSSILRKLVEHLPADHVRALPPRSALPPWPESTLVDSLPLSLADSLELLAACGLAEARLLLRNPNELSDGQFARFQLAHALAHKPRWIAVDEFTAILDRDLARVIAFNLRRLASKHNVGFLLATTHLDILDDLQPTLHIDCSNPAAPSISRSTVKKKTSPSPNPSSSPPDFAQTGRTLLAGTIAATPRASFNSSPSSGSPMPA